jgi:hypothetical protein
MAACNLEWVEGLNADAAACDALASEPPEDDSEVMFREAAIHLRAAAHCLEMAIQRAPLPKRRADLRSLRDCVVRYQEHNMKRTLEYYLGDENT